MGRAGRRKRDELAYETFDGSGCSTGLQLELAPGSGVFPTTSGSWGLSDYQRQVASNPPRGARGQEGAAQCGQLRLSSQEAAVQRALAMAGFIDVASPASRAKRSKGAHA